MRSCWDPRPPTRIRRVENRPLRGSVSSREAIDLCGLLAHLGLWLRFGAVGFNTMASSRVASSFKAAIAASL